MIPLLDQISRLFLAGLDAERAQNIALIGLRKLEPFLKRPQDDPRLSVSAFGLEFPNPVGLAAGADKNAEIPDTMLRAGFGFVEAGTLTPHAQTGSPRPRIFRLPLDQAIINRRGFSNDGYEAAFVRLQARASKGGIVGVNIGANKDSSDRIGDYAQGIARFAPLASYLTINVSSPNTPGLRDLQQADALDSLLARSVEARDRVGGRRCPLLLKIAPDLALRELDDVVRVAKQRGIDGMIVSNTTITRPRDLQERLVASETGGLSGPPLFSLSTQMLAETYVRVDGAFPLVGVGGIDSGMAALRKIKAGASLLQLYTGLVYQGLSLVKAINREIASHMAVNNVGALSDMVGSEAAARVAEPVSSQKDLRRRAG